MRYSPVFRYLVAGCGTTLLVISSLFVLNSIFHIQYIVASSISFVIGLIAAYIVHKYWTFENDSPDHIRQFGGHTILLVWNFILNALLMYAFVDGLAMPPILGQAFAAILIATESYLVYSKHIFA